LLGWAGVCRRRGLALSAEWWPLPAEGVGLATGFGSGRLSAAAERTDETTHPSCVKLRDESLERRQSGGGMGQGFCTGEGIGEGTGTASTWLRESEGEGTMVGSACSKKICLSLFDRYSSRRTSGMRRVVQRRDWRMLWGMHLLKYFLYSANTRSCKISNHMAARRFDHLCRAIEDRVEAEVRSTRPRA